MAADGKVPRYLVKFYRFISNLSTLLSLGGRTEGREIGRELKSLLYLLENWGRPPEKHPVSPPAQSLARPCPFAESRHATPLHLWLNILGPLGLRGHVIAHCG